MPGPGWRGEDSTDMDSSTRFDDLTRRIVAFRDARNWKQFHNAKDLALALSIEAAELNEIFLWKNAEDADRQRLAEELADVLIYGLLLEHENGLDVGKIVLEKLEKNGIKYPVEKAKNSAKKYTELE